MNSEKEYRLLHVQFRASTDEKSIEGYAAVFNTVTDLGWFSEQIAPGAFKRAIAEKQDVRCLFNHDPNQVLGRTKSGTLTLEEDNTGLKFSCDMPDTTIGNDVRSMIKRGDVDQCSFGFIVMQESIAYGDDGTATRTIQDCDLFDVSPVTFAAYPTTSVQARSIEKVGKALKRADDDGTPDVDPDAEEFNEAMGIHHLDESSAHAEHATRCRSLAAASDDDDLAQHLRASAKMHDEHSDRCAYRAALCFERAADYRGDSSERSASKKTKRVAGEDLTADCFLYVGDPEKTATWALPYKFSTEEKTKSHLRNALARFDQTSTIPSDKKAEVKSKLLAKCKEYGIDTAETNAADMSLEVAKARTYLAGLSL